MDQAKSLRAMIGEVLGRQELQLSLVPPLADLLKLDVEVNLAFLGLKATGTDDTVMTWLELTGEVHTDFMAGVATLRSTGDLSAVERATVEGTEKYRSLLSGAAERQGEP